MTFNQRSWTSRGNCDGCQQGICTNYNSKKETATQSLQRLTIKHVADDFVVADYIPNDQILTISVNGIETKQSPYDFFKDREFIYESPTVHLKDFKNDRRFSKYTTSDMSEKTVRLTYFSSFFVLEVIHGAFDKEFFVITPKPSDSEMLSNVMSSLAMAELDLFSDYSDIRDFMLCLRLSVMLSKFYGTCNKSLWQKILEW